jgi:hypothetical protein
MPTSAREIMDNGKGEGTVLGKKSNPVNYINNVKLSEN